MSGCLVGHGLSRDDPKGRCKRRTLVRCYQPDPLEVSGLSSPNLPGNPAWARQAPLSARGPAPTAPAARRRPPSPAASTPPPAAAATAGRRACLRGGGTLGLQRRSEVRQAGVGAPPHRHVLAHRQTLAGLLLAARQRQVGVEPAERLVADGFAVWKARDRPSALRRLSRVGHRKLRRIGRTTGIASRGRAKPQDVATAQEGGSGCRSKVPLVWPRTRSAALTPW